MNLYLWLCLWLMSLLVATFLGYDRGRWSTGLLLGLLFGPLGVIAAGLMQPSVEYSGERAYALQHELARLHKRDRLAARRRRRARAEMEAWASDVEQQAESQEVGFADGLQELADSMDTLEQTGATPDMKSREWATWLRDKADVVRSSPRYEEDEK